MWVSTSSADQRPREEPTMPEPLKKRDESESTEDDVVAHRYVSDAPDEDDPEKKRKRKMSDEPGEDDFGKRKK
jgi:hypothetical protein